MAEKFTGVSHLYYAPSDGSKPLREVKTSEPVSLESEEKPDDTPLRSVGPITFTINADSKTFRNLFPKGHVPRKVKKGVVHLFRGRKQSKALRTLLRFGKHNNDTGSAFKLNRYIRKIRSL